MKHVFTLTDCNEYYKEINSLEELFQTLKDLKKEGMNHIHLDYDLEDGKIDSTITIMIDNTPIHGATYLSSRN